LGLRCRAGLVGPAPGTPLDDENEGRLGQVAEGLESGVASLISGGLKGLVAR
jgi:hypothetical protein